jgi:hypothetical protein
MSWLQSLLKTDKVKRLSYKQTQEAIAEHQKWKHRFTSAVRGTVAFDFDAAARDDQCALGKWLHGEGMRDFGAHAEFQELLETHRHFHTQAAHTHALAVNGKGKEAEYELRCGEFEQTSLALYRHLIRLERETSLQE